MRESIDDLGDFSGKACCFCSLENTGIGLSTIRCVRRGGGLMYGLEEEMPSDEKGCGEETRAIGAADFSLSVIPLIGEVGDIGGDLALRTLPVLLFGLGGGGSPVNVSNASPDRWLGPGVSDRSVVLRVCSSYSRAALRLGEINIGLGFIGANSCGSL